jgi:hypothetical protein
MNPMRGVQPWDTAFGPRPADLDRANRYVSEEGAWQGFDPMRNAHGVMVMANEPSRTGCRRRRAKVSASAVKSPSNAAPLTSERS